MTKDVNMEKDQYINEYNQAVLETKAFYDRFAEYYDEFVPPQNRKVRIEPIINFVRQKTGSPDRPLKFLKLGCGTASYALPLAQKGHNVVGVDISAKMRNIAMEKIKQGLETVEYVQNDWVTAMESWVNEFDCILCIGNSLIHNPPNTLPLIFSRAFNSLKPNGVFILNGRHIETELDMVDGPDNKQNEICRSGGPAIIPERGQVNALRFMFMTKVTKIVNGNIKNVITFYTYDNYEFDRRRFVCYRLIFDIGKEVETKPEQFDCFSTKNYFIYEKKVIDQLKMAGFIEAKRESPDINYFKLGKTWYVTALKP